MKKLLILFLFSFLLACSNYTKKELLVGSWQVVSVNLAEPTKADENAKKFIQRLSREKREPSAHLKGYNFGNDSILREWDENKIREIDENDPPIEYHITDENNIENENGDIISTILYKRDGTIYKGTNKPGPFKIISLSKDELTLMDIRPKFKDIGFIIVKYKKVNE